MNKKYIEKTGSVIVDHGSRYLDVRMNKKIMHYLQEGLAKYYEGVNKLEKAQIEIIVDELNEIKKEFIS